MYTVYILPTKCNVPSWPFVNQHDRRVKWAQIGQEVGMRLHHIGVVVRDVLKSAEAYESLFGLRVVMGPKEDPIQRVNAIFLDLGCGEGVTLELLEPTREDSPISGFLRKGGGLHHLCFEVEDIEGTVAKMRDKGLRVVCEPVPACGFGGRRIAFVFPVEGILVEFVEARSGEEKNR